MLRESELIVEREIVQTCVARALDIEDGVIKQVA